MEYSLSSYSEHALEVGSTSKAVSYVEIIDKDGNSFWGAGTDDDIIKSSIKALVSAINNKLTAA
jgi:2-isopropylmalate synthase